MIFDQLARQGLNWSRQMDFRTTIEKNFETLAHQTLDHLHLRTLAQIVGAGLEAQAELSNSPLSRAQDHLDGAVHVLGITRHERFQQGKFQIQFLGLVGNGPQILGQAGATEGKARRQVRPGDVQLGVGSEDLRDRLCVHAQVFTHRAHLVGETDFHGVIAVRKILDHFRHRNRRLVKSAGRVLIKLAQRRKMVAVTRPENRVGRIQEICHRAAFAHELRVVADREVPATLLAAFFFQDRQDDGLGSPRQHRAAQNENVW